ncbi:MAG TPA: PrgI family protein [Candidatus Saccharimonadales bacterium]|nr:PrgI family protein [Candidatus Saccharimonadales bacterium]
MQSHPVPQNITGFEFKLIGFLTLRQFGYLAAAAIFIFILYSSKLPFPIVLLVGGPVGLFAIALAFVSFNNMPFERWIAAFFKTVYSPNTRVWHHEPKEIGFLEPQFSIYLHRQATAVEPKIYSDPSKLKLYLQTHRKGASKSILDINEERRLTNLNLNSATSESQVFAAPSLQPKEGEFNPATVGFQRMAEVVDSAKNRSAGEGSG